MRYSYFISLLFFLGSFSFLGQESIVSNFVGEQVGNKVLLSWLIKAGNTCNGIDIERQTEDGGFIEIGHISGVCGNLTEASSYVFSDISPIKNSVNKYRLLLGSSTYSEIIEVEYFDLSVEKYHLRHYDDYKKVKITFVKPGNSKALMQIMDLSGKKLAVIETTQNFFEFELDTFAKGMNLFSITNSESKSEILGKLYVY